ncbi:hypothetical protein [Rickettsiales endosymbiont of Trichoplax sp. H2]|uniref:hypothetical protein n=1 Tax=Rickettsiales endosymbiont of Trichoplax sp. H2 TaxID=2021221 RepID=UPI0012B3C8A7|nr:hypothetical protein [Rickettsiales endosymbiont of Trichoplax sp. H2]MSO14388.1 hypothetical protein [Rickettsiales endosymbiont of Trichoplax sp. H2]
MKQKSITTIFTALLIMAMFVSLVSNACEKHNSNKQAKRSSQIIDDEGDEDVDVEDHNEEDETDNEST